MHLILKNFKQWSDLEIKTPDQGIILIKGRSGIGKSSVLSAIYFALFGIGSKIVKFGTSSCEVSLQIYDLNIKRKKLSDKLWLNYLADPSKIYEDQIAQHIIDSKFGHKNFLITSYITQKPTKSFLALTQSEKFAFFENLISENNQISNIKTSLKSSLDAENQKLKITIEKEKLIEQSIGELGLFNDEEKQFMLTFKVQTPLDENKEIDLLESEFNSDNIVLSNLMKQFEKHSQAMEQIKHYETQATTLEHLLKSRMDQDSNKYDGKILEEIQIDIKMNKEWKQFLTIKQKYDDCQKQINEISLSKDKYTSTLVMSQKQLDKVIADLKLYDVDKLKSLSNSLHSLATILDDQSKQLDLAKSKLDNYDHEDSIYQRIKDIQNIIDLKNIHECPECHKQLLLKDGSLIVYNDRILSLTNERIYTPLECNQLVKKLQEFKKQHSIVLSLSDQILSLETVIQANEQKKLDLELGYNYSDLTKANGLSKLKDQITIDMKSDQKFVEYYNGKLPSLYKTFEDLQNQINLFSNKTDKNINQIEEAVETLILKEKEQTNLKICFQQSQQQIFELKSQLSDNRNNMAKSKGSLDDLKYHQKDVDTLKDKIQDNKLMQHKLLQQKCLKDKYENLSKRQKSIDNHLLKIGQGKLEQADINKKTQYIQKLLLHVSEAQSLALIQQIESLNFFVNKTLESFFSEDPMIVKLNVFKENKKCLKAFLNFDIFYKNQNTDLNSLSGGEYDRLQLAFYLAFNQMFSANLVMLDESISSLDNHQANKVIKSFHDSLKQKLILVVSHQMIEGEFTHLIDLDNY